MREDRKKREALQEEERKRELAEEKLKQEREVSTGLHWARLARDSLIRRRRRDGGRRNRLGEVGARGVPAAQGELCDKRPMHC